MNILMSILTLEHTLLSVVNHVYISVDTFQVIFKLSKELAESSKEFYPKPIYLELVH